MGGIRNPIEIESANPISQKIIDAVALTTNGRIVMAFNERQRTGHSDLDDQIESVIGRKP